MAQAVAQAPRGEESEWKAKLALPPKDTRIRTEVRDKIVSAAMSCASMHGWEIERAIGMH